MRILDKLTNFTRGKPVAGRHSHDDELGEDLVTRIERKVLSLISDDGFKIQTFEKKEEQILSELSFLEKYLAKSEETQSFLCGEFLIYDREKIRLTSVARYPIETSYKYDRDPQLPTFHRIGTAPKVITRQREQHDKFVEQKLLFSRFIRKSPAEKRVLIILVQQGKVPNPELKEFQRKLHADLAKHKLAQATWIGITDIVDAKQFRWGGRAGALAEFEKINSKAELTESEVTEFKQESKARYRMLDDYFRGLLRYSTPQDTEHGYVIVYCPAIFAADEPPANFWGMFSAKKFHEHPAEAEQFLHNIINIETSLSTIMSQIVGLYAVKRANEVKSHATRAAVVSVMARNMSHNIGSHVLTGLSSPQQLECIDKEEMAPLNAYLQTRMDFLADLATSIPFVTVPKKLYADVCVYLKPYKRDSGVDWQFLLMDRISGSSDIDASKITIAVTVDSNGPVNVTLSTPDEDPIFASPNDMLGAHALYVILENVIRNSVKHSKVGEELKLTVLTEQFNEDYWRIKLFDNVGQCSATTTTETDRLIKKLNDLIDEPVLEATDGSLRRRGWGMLEMKIAAAYLRKVLPADVDQEQTPRLITALSEQGNLGFEFYLLKPKCALIANFGQPLDEQVIERLKPMGLNVVGRKILEAGTDHEFLILIDPQPDDYFAVKLEAGKLPSRVFLCSKSPPKDFVATPLDKNKLLSILETGSLEVIREYLWKKRAESGAGGETFMMRGVGEKEYEVLSGDPRVIREERNWHFFDNHGSRFKQIVNPDDRKQTAYYEPYETKSPTGLILGHLPTDKRRRNTLISELIEATRLEVVVVDERIQGASKQPCTVYHGITNYVANNGGSQPTQAEVLKWMKIIVSQDLDLNKQKFDGRDKQKLEDELNKICGSNHLLIHLGIIEKLVGTDKDAISKWISHWRTKFDDLIITSGRGRPSNMPGDVRFLHYSHVARYLLAERSKYHLSKVLFSSRSIAT